MAINVCIVYHSGFGHTAKQAEAVAEAQASGDARPGFVEDDPSTWGNPSRNDPCPCGSGKKFKHCHGRLA